MALTLAASLWAVGMVYRTKTAPENLADHEMRARVLDLLRRDPGLRLVDLTRHLGTPKSTMQYHLTLMERRGAVLKHQRGRASHYFLADVDEEVREKCSLVHEPITEGIVGCVIASPGLIQKDIEEATGATRKMLRPRISAMVEGGFLIEERHNGSCHYEGTPALYQLVKEIPALLERLAEDAPFDHPDANQARGDDRPEHDRRPGIEPEKISL